MTEGGRAEPALHLAPIDFVAIRVNVDRFPSGKAEK